VHSEAVFRKPLFYGVAAIAVAGCFAAFVVEAVSKPNGSSPEAGSRGLGEQIKSAQARAAAAGGAPDDDFYDQNYRCRVNFQAWPFVIPLAAMEQVAGLSYGLH
jgi:hypothetical protein